MIASQARARAGLLLVAAAALLATAAKLAWALHSAGSCDVVFFFQFGEALNRSTLAECYAREPMFNHTPLTAVLIRGLYAACRADYATFAAALRGLSIVADLGVVALLLWVRRRTGRPPWWALALFAASPVSLMVSGFHGNVDPLMVLCLCGAAVALLEGRPALCGALFALAANLKVMPLLLAPVFLCYWSVRDRRALLRFAGAAGALGPLGSAVPLVQCPGLYLQKVLGYGSYWGSWGFTHWLLETGAAPFQKFDFENLDPAQNQIVRGLKIVIVLAVAAFAWRRRQVNAPEVFTTLAAAFTIVFVFAPGVGPQYLVWAAPFLVWTSPGWFAAIAATSAIFMATFYHSTAQWHFPWDFANPNGPEFLFWGPWTNLPWLTYALLLATQARGWWMGHATAAAPAGGVSRGR